MSPPYVIRLGLLALAGVIAGPAVGDAAFTADDLVRLNRVSDPQLSADGRYIAVVLRTTDMPANQGRTHLVIIDRAGPSAIARPLAWSTANDWSPRWAARGRMLYFLSLRSGSAQVWRVPGGGGAPAQVTDYPLDIAGFKLSPAHERMALSMEVLPECADLKCTKDELERRHGAATGGRPAGSTGRVYTKLFVRHWDTWSNGARSHLFVAQLQSDGRATAPIDVSKPLDADVPSKPFGGDEEYAFSPDGAQIVFAARIAGTSEPWSTNFDLFEAAVDGASAPINLTQTNLAADTQPVFLKNGDLAYLAADRPGFEADRFHVVVRNARTGSAHALTAAWDRSVMRLGATADGRTLLATAADGGQEALFAIDPASGTPRKIIATGEVSAFAATNDAVVFAWANLAAPADLYITRLAGGPPRRLTAVNQTLLSERSLSAYEQFSFKGWHDETVYGYVMKPYGFEPGKQFPIAFIIHGGPQGSFQNLWNYRWNAQTFAGRGYGVVMIDFHGSPGYGQAFTDSISKDWGGKPLVDLQKGLAAAIARYPWLDGTRACALGASYGGFMINWIAGNWPDRFRCLVNHDGVFDQRMMYYSTEELWFAEWENGGTYYERPQLFEDFNPVTFVPRWRTPMLVIHGEQDFRIPYTQGLAAFTALQRRGIESKLLLFPDENHWVLKPANSLLWHATVLEWLDAHLKN
jgi:dipeptidyl aminopeptidase/acylaminoacyl peptidase